MNIEIICDSKPLQTYVDLLKHFIQVSQRSFDFSDFGFELARVELDNCATSTGKLIVTLYPSDALLRFTATVVTGDLNASIIK